ncbi:MAG: ABC transporter ATP-binding protein [Chloroflexota bacterium]|nr:ABC transporter ATP-binding protein [Chloroflexota bacterium]
MSDIAVRVENLGKQYHIGERAHYKTVRETFSGLVGTPFARMRGRSREKSSSDHFRTNTFWALRNVSFELKQGELLGIIGRNGAGKSTLLKILSQITEPTEGVADIRGRVRSLLEVGTGFHPELTGRENIFLNGAILGMKRAEIARKFDEIVAFAEIARFIDTPVKWYSSGMYTRLAFSVAAHLEPDVLIVDEVLAVGDTSFQARCLAKMQEVSEGGRTVFFVSHMMHAISKLCQRVMLIDGGMVVADGSADQVVSDYMELVVGTTGTKHWAEPSAAPGAGSIHLRSVRVRLEDGQVTDTVDVSSPVAIEMQFDVLDPDLLLVPTFQFFDRQGTCLFVSSNPRLSSRPTAVGRYTSTCWIPGNFLAEGTVMATAVIASADSPTLHIYEQHAVAFEVTDNTARALTGYLGPYPGVVRPLLDWTTDVATLTEDSVVRA